jgi:hypothetical protein
MSAKKSSAVEAPVAAPAVGTASAVSNQLTTKRFVIRKSLIGTNTVITFTNHKNEVKTYNHDVVYNQLKAKFDLMPCFDKYGSYTNSKDLPAFVRSLPNLV